jgi:outer membrane lipoprotein carrier protein
MRARLGLALLLLLLPGSPAAAGGDPGAAVDPCVRAAVEAVQKRYESVRDLSARFEQTTFSVALGRAGASSTSRGRVVFAKPGRMRWHYEEPEESLVVSDGHWLWIYDPAHREAQKLEVGEAWLSGAAIQFLLGEGQILRDFDTRADACDAREAQLVLVPRRPATYEELRLRVDPRSGDVLETEVHDLLGNVTRVSFQDLEFDTNPAPELFRFQAPKGVTVLEMDESPAR